jgi:TIR domain
MSRIFISHSHMDRAFTERLASDLSGSGLDVWYSEWQMRPGDSLTRKIADGIISSGIMLVLLSENSVQSEWVERELSLALCNSLANKNVRILPVLLEACAFPRSFHFLGDTIYADFRDDYVAAFQRLLSALGVRPSKRGIKVYDGDLLSLEALEPGGIAVARVEGLEQIWKFNRLFDSIELSLESHRRVSDPLMRIPLTNGKASRLSTCMRPATGATMI